MFWDALLVLLTGLAEPDGSSVRVSMLMYFRPMKSFFVVVSFLCHSFFYRRLLYIFCQLLVNMLNHTTSSSSTTLRKPREPEQAIAMEGRNVNL